MPELNNSIAARAVYERSKLALIQAGLDPRSVENAKLTQTDIILETLLSTTQNAFPFQILNNTVTGGIPQRPTERRLKLQDAFYVSTMFIYLAKYSSASATDGVSKTYPNVVTFPTGGGPTGALYTFYNGQFTLSVNNEVVVPGMDLQRYLNVPQTQLTAAANSPQDEFDGSTKLIVEPNLVLIGQKDNIMSINLPGNITTIDTFTYARIVLEGVLAQNVTLVS
ncbi:MAG: hypothetical protein V4501_12225 [Pseudomonadota bacterium]